MLLKFRSTLYFLCALAFSADAFACDLCAIYNAAHMEAPESGKFVAGIAEQFTSFGDVQLDGKKQDNDEHQHMRSSVTQVFGAYAPIESLQLQLSLPYINRRFKRVNDGEIDTGTEAGIGDMTLMARVFPYTYEEGEQTLFFQIYGGLKLPTGDSDRLAEEQEEEGHDEEDGHHEKHAGHHHEDEEVTASAIHGHDLALGSGSWDFPVGAAVTARSGRMFIGADVQYFLRTEGSHDYRYANDLLWSTGPGGYIYLDHSTQVAARVILSGEYKKDDEGEDGTAINSLFLGPDFSAYVNEKVSANVGFDLPLDIKNSGLQTVPDYRIRAGVTYRF